MKDMRIILTTLGLALVACVPCATRAGEKGAPSGESKPTPDQLAIHKNAEAFINAFNKGDAKEVAAIFAANGQMSVDGQTIAVGREAIEKAYADFFKDRPGVQINVTIDSIRLLGPNLAIEKGSS